MSVSKIDEQCLIRTGSLEDAEAILNIQNSVIAEGDYLITVSEEFTKTPVQQRDWIKRILENERETLIGSLYLTPLKFNRAKNKKATERVCSRN